MDCQPSEIAVFSKADCGLPTAMRIVLIGPPGAGKGTQAVRLAGWLEVPHLSTGEMLREACRLKTDVGRMSEPFMTSGRLVPDEVVQKLVVERVARDDCAGGYLLDGFPRTAPQAKMLDNLLAGCGMTVDAAIKIEVDEDVLMERLAGRRRHDDEDAVIRQRLDHYRQLTQPMEAYYEAAGRLRVVDGHGSPDEVFDRIVAELQAVDPAS